MNPSSGNLPTAEGYAILTAFAESPKGTPSILHATQRIDQRFKRFAWNLVEVLVMCHNVG